MQSDEFIERVLSSPFVDDQLCRNYLGGSKESIQAASEYLDLPESSRPEISYFFDRKYYTTRYPDIADRGDDPFEHYIRWGCLEGRSPHALVQPAHIRSVDPFLLPEKCSLQELFELLTFDLADPSPYFSIEFYRTQIDSTCPSGLLHHFLKIGLAQGLKPNAYLDPMWYYSQIEGLKDTAAGIRHFVLFGDREARAPSPRFSGRKYLDCYPDVAAAGMPPLEHFLTSGKVEGRSSLSEHDAQTQALILLKAREEVAFGGIGQAQSPLLYEEFKRKVIEIRQELKDKVSVRSAGILVVKNAPRHLSKLIFPRARRPKVSILIPVYNELSFTVECLASIRASQSKVAYEVIVADDASTDPGILKLTNVQNIRLERQPTNVGFLANCNAALLACRGDYVLLLNNDAQLMPGALDQLVEVLESNPDVAAVGPKILYPNGRLQEAGCAIDSDGISTMVGLFADPDQPGYSYGRDVHYCSGAALLVRRSDIGETLFDEAFRPAYCEDADLCLRLTSLGRRVVYCPRAEVVHHLSVSTSKQSETRRRQIVVRNQQTLACKWASLLERINNVRVIAFYLPQYHPTPENDFHWGQGFTEWTNVAKAMPGYAGHYQPHLPADLGFYDLRVRQTIERQVTLARRYNIAGFCVYYYNFGARRALEQAFEAIVADRTIDFPYCICWANENWTRHWDGGTREPIFEQQYDSKTLQMVVQDAIRYATDPRYLRVNGKPLLVIYRPLLIPEPKVFANLCRRAFRKAGHDGVHLVYVESMETAAKSLPPADIGFDACVEFPPHGRAVAATMNPTLVRDDFLGTRYDYEATILADLRRPSPGYKRYPTVFPGWDNTPRQPLRGDSFIHATPEAFQVYVEEKLELLRQLFVGDERLLFINAWNEWAEGTHLEPDQKFGHRWLEAVHNALLAKSLV